ncbi:MAG: hypothetical protein H0X50_02695 [Nitrosopumilus sp.]|nr:hypothetical protein [Nitrosopumilus sp.]
MKYQNIVLVISAIVLSGTMVSFVSSNIVFADESQAKVDEKHERVEDKHGFGSQQDVKFHEKHGFPDNPVLGDLSCQEGKKDNLASYGC